MRIGLPSPRRWVYDFIVPGMGRAAELAGGELVLLPNPLDPNRRVHFIRRQDESVVKIDQAHVINLALMEDYAGITSYIISLC